MIGKKTQGRELKVPSAETQAILETEASNYPPPPFVNV